MKLASAFLLLSLSTALAACATDDDEVCSGGSCVAQVICGPGTHAEVGVCVPDEVAPPCERGTHEMDGACVADVQCGPGTYALNGRCIPETVAPTCPTGTHEVDGDCVPDVACGPLTHVEAGLCVPDVECGDDQHDLAGACVPDFGYEIRVVTPTVDADGFSKIPVFVIGTAADGSPARDRMVLTVSQGGGRLLTREVTLSPVGNTVYFVPCNAMVDRTCAGTTTLTIARAEAPSLALATAEIELVMPTGVGATAPCEIGGNVLFLDGNDSVFDGTMTITQADWNPIQRSADRLYVHIDPAAASQGTLWRVEFTTSELGIPMVPGVYDDARGPFNDDGRPGMEIGEGGGCSHLSGRFQVHEYVVTDRVLDSALVTFEQRCNGSPNRLRGCFRYQRQP